MPFPCCLLSPISVAANQTILSCIQAVKMVLQFLTWAIFLGPSHSLCLVSWDSSSCLVLHVRCTCLGRLFMFSQHCPSRLYWMGLWWKAQQSQKRKIAKKRGKRLGRFKINDSHEICPERKLTASLITNVCILGKRLSQGYFCLKFCSCWSSISAALCRTVN